ncbi:hypothetical protein ACIBSW_13635 [Actinoplanes sp. NPDC049668]|uniref:hypothetical protein n=1 Tax=unclassified Actinoplanes TaxID=2626549 RepID=UPI0033BD7667
MTSQDPYGTQELPRFATGYAQYPPAPDHYAPSVSSPPAGPADGFRAVAYPQEGAAYSPEPVPYPQLTVAGVQLGASGQHQGGAAPAYAPEATPAGAPQGGGDADDDGYPETSGLRRHGAHLPGGEVAYPPAVAPSLPASGPARPGPYPPAGYAPAGAPAGYAPTGYAPSGYGPAGGPAPVAGAAPSAYPTSPPWAATAQLSPVTAHTVPAQPATEHGSLLVPYPDEMRNASRAHPPAVWPVTVFTLLFGVLGVISAARRAADARRGRNSTAPYWVTFLVTLAASSFIWFVVGAVVIEPLFTDIREGQRLAAVEDSVLHDGQLQKANITADKAECRAIAERGADGMREYLCRLTLNDGRTATLTLTADADGTWVSRSAD